MERALKSSKDVKYLRDLSTYKINNHFLNDDIQLIRKNHTNSLLFMYDKMYVYIIKIGLFLNNSYMYILHYNYSLPFPYYYSLLIISQIHKLCICSENHVV